MAGWCLRAVATENDKITLEALFSTGGETPVSFKVVAKAPISTGQRAWHHFGLVWDGGAKKALLFIDAKLAGEGVAPEEFDLAVADRNAFRGIRIAGRPSSEEGKGSDHWVGRLDDMKFYAEVTAGQAAMMAEYAPSKPKPPPPPEPVVARKPEPKPGPVTPTPPPKPTEKIPDLRGTSMEASMVVPVVPVEDRVLLQTADGVRFTLLLERLSEGDRAFVSEP